jgi:integrase
MPAAQRGQVFKRNGSWHARWRERGRRRQKGGFLTKTEAGEFLDEQLKRVRLGPAYRPQVTLATLVDKYLAQHQAEPATIARLRAMLKHATHAFGSVPLDELLADEIGAWRARLSPGVRHDATQALRQVLNAGVRWRMLTDNPARHVSNPRPHRPEIRPLASWEELELLAAELGALPIFAAGTGLMPEEWIALERRDLDLKARVVLVQRFYSNGAVKHYGKNERRRRRVPLRQRVVDAIEAAPRRIDSPLVFPAARGGHLSLHNWRAREWDPALRAAGFYHCEACDRDMRRRKGERVYGCERCSATLPVRRPYDLRHTYATFSLAAGVSLYTLARRMGTSVEMIDRTYGHLAPDADEFELGLLDAWDARHDVEAQER